MNQKPTSLLVIAILGIITSAFVILLTPCSLYLFFKPLAPNPIVDEMGKDHIYAIITVTSNLIGFFLNVALLALSISALKLVSWARLGMMLYACVMIAWTLVTTAVTFAYVVPLMSHILTAKFPTVYYALYVGIATGFLAFLYQLALPITILICFRRTSVVNAFKGIFPASSNTFPVEHADPFPPA